MKLSQSTRLESNKGRGNSLADREVGRVNTAELAPSASDLLRLMLKCTVDVSGGSIHVLIRDVNDVAVADGSVEDVGELLREVIEDRFVNSEVLSKNITGRVGKPVVNVKGGADAVEVAVIEDKEELVVIVQTTDMDPVSYRPKKRRSSYQLTLEQCGRHPRGSTRYLRSSRWWLRTRRSRPQQRQGRGQHRQSPIRPRRHTCQHRRIGDFGIGETHDTVPVKLTDSTLAQVLLSSSDVMAGGKVRNDLLSNPAAVEDARLGVRESPFQAGDATSIGALLAETVGGLTVSPVVCSTWLLSLVSDLQSLTCYVVFISIAKYMDRFVLTKNRGTLAITTDGLALMELALIALLKLRNTEDTSNEGQGYKAQTSRNLHDGR